MTTRTATSEAPAPLTLQAPPRCGDCGGPMVLREAGTGPFYGCRRYPECKGTHGAHADGRPLGIPADAETREARKAAHAAFDELWKRRWMRRTEAYRQMRADLGHTEESGHIGAMTKRECELVRDWAEAVLIELRTAAQSRRTS